ncbi:MAG: bifunctional adenosylcobinamide kinase/adenosylcobinamide-phosphate guanylyltransferase [Nitrospinae bacterium]|nr:bifunctional adenosylcobinamide kinase/adenosylcobinamide-phosphate guanylyltransferase [Nitrospinota bacterium]
MGKLTLVTGGCRSGKSAFAQNLAEKSGRARYFIATAQALDGEMAERIALHMKKREGKGFTVIEEPLDLAGAIESVPAGCVAIVDCLSLWVSNMMLAHDGVKENDIASAALEFLNQAKASGADFIFVTNEVGLGIVPDNAMGRSYRDLLGRANQQTAAMADGVYMLISGIPLSLKNGGS